MPKKLNYDYIYNFFQEHRCKLLETEYINSQTKMKYICQCGNESYISFNSFQQGKRCLYCNKYSYEEVKQYFADNDCELLEDCYINNYTKMKYRCKCGNIAYIDFEYFKRGQRCNVCKSQRLSESKRLPYDYVNQVFFDNGYILLDDNYINSHTKIKCIHIKCNSVVYGTYGTVSSGGEICKKCGNEKTAIKLRHNVDYIYNYFKNYGYEVEASNYINNETKLKYVCDQGHQGYMHFNNFKNGKRCPLCSESHGEKVITECLVKDNINYEREFRINDCRNKRSLPFDFAIFDEYNNLQCLIEYDGQQHFMPMDYFGGEDALQYTQQNDYIKTNYCKENNIPLLRIPYWDFDNIESILNSYFFMSKNNQT